MVSLGTIDRLSRARLRLPPRRLPLSFAYVRARSIRLRALHSRARGCWAAVRARIIVAPATLWVRGLVACEKIAVLL